MQMAESHWLVYEHSLQNCLNFSVYLKIFIIKRENFYPGEEGAFEILKAAESNGRKIQKVWQTAGYSEWLEWCGQVRTGRAQTTDSQESYCPAYTAHVVRET